MGAGDSPAPILIPTGHHCTASTAMTVVTVFDGNGYVVVLAAVKKVGIVTTSSESSSR